MFDTLKGLYYQLFLFETELSEADHSFDPEYFIDLADELIPNLEQEIKDYINGNL